MKIVNGIEISSEQYEKMLTMLQTGTDENGFLLSAFEYNGLKRFIECYEHTSDSE